MKKKIMALLLAATMLLSLTACGNGEKTEGTKKADETTKITTVTEAETTAAQTEVAKDSRFTHSDTVSIEFVGNTITVNYSGWPCSNIFDHLNDGVYSYCGIAFTEGSDTADYSTSVSISTYGDGKASANINCGLIKIWGGTVTFGENGRPMTAVFKNIKSEDMTGIIEAIDMTGVIRINDSLNNNYDVAYIKDVVTVAKTDSVTESARNTESPKSVPTSDMLAGMWYCAANGCTMTFEGSSEYGYSVDVTPSDGGNYIIDIMGEEIDGTSIRSKAIDMEYEYEAYYNFDVNGDSFTFEHLFGSERTVVSDSGVYTRS